MMIRTTFQEVKLTGVKNVRCNMCSKKIRRQYTPFQTLSPFNKKKNGEVKTRNDIMAELKEKIEKWKKEEERCKACIAKLPRLRYSAC